MTVTACFDRRELLRALGVDPDGSSVLTLEPVCVTADPIRSHTVTASGLEAHAVTADIPNVSTVVTVEAPTTITTLLDPIVVEGFFKEDP